MASFGAKYPCFKGENDTSGIVIGRLVTANLTVNLASGELYSDDALSEQLSEFASGSIAMETDDLTDDKASKIYGCTVSGGEVTYSTGDTSPKGCLAYYKKIMRNGVKYFKGVYYPYVRAALGNDNAQTKGSSITFTTESTTFTVFADANGDWRSTETFTTEPAAKAWCETKCSISNYYEINVSCQGATTGEGVDVDGKVYVAAGDDFVLHVTGYANVTAAYDNGAVITATITGGNGTYTITDIAAAHTIAIIF